ncbi:MAG: DUF3990 domain-containing protein [Lachnospiraceae bacterium]|jgi:hypothetical protein|nr:DUF3990 domain-containing protein [Lachnospiraceae bacterium]
MILYHTSEQEIRNPDIHYGRRNADFGWGFYLTPDRDFTYRWAKENAVVNEYELDEKGLNICTFTRDINWFQYIFNNRRMKDGLTADIVIGPIANDTIFNTFGIMSSGFLKPENALKLLMIGPEYTQVAIKTEKAAKQLRFVRSEKIRHISKDAFQLEQEAYQESFAQEFEKLINQ